jgi:DAK2 domain fusion protein YloV
VLDSLDAAAVRSWCAAGLEALRRHQAEIDELNVFPVPDGDTGTNLVLTVGSAWQALAAEPEALDPPETDVARLTRILRCMARGALLGARGNSGVIVSQLLRGIADALAGTPARVVAEGPAEQPRELAEGPSEQPRELAERPSGQAARGRALAEALTAAAKAAYAAVADPVEGTVLSVATGAALAAVAADSDDLGTVVRAAATGAAEALARTPQQLPALARAGVVDAGGRGLVVLLDALVEVVTGHAPQPAAAAMEATAAVGVVVRDPAGLTGLRESGSDQFAYEVQYLLDATAEAVEALKARLAGLGDSLVVVGGSDQDDSVWNVHVHVNDVGAAIEAGVEAGRPYRISVTRFADQTQAPIQVLSDVDARGLVVVAGGAGLGALFAAEGAVVVDGGPTSNPSTSELLAAVRATGAGRVVLLPNDSNVHAVASAAAAEARNEGIRVGVVPTRSPVQALAAIAVRDTSRRFNDDLIAMAEAVGACRYAEVTIAVRAALTMAGRCEPGDVLALVEGEVNLIGRDLGQVCRTVLDRMLGGGGELVTLLLGEDAPDGLGAELAEHIAAAWPFADVQVYEGGQPNYPLLIGVE